MPARRTSLLAVPLLAVPLVALLGLPSQAHAKERLRGKAIRVPAVAQPAEDDVPRILFLNRCEGGCVITPGDNDAINNTSILVGATTNFPPFAHGDTVWNQVVECVREQYAAFNITITDVDPGNQPHFEAIVAGDAASAGHAGAAGVAPASCGLLPNSINFNFADTIGPDVEQLCWTIAQESGHTFGLEHELLCEDPMTYLDGCGPKRFQDVDAECGEFEARPCECGNATQNSVQHLFAMFGSSNPEPSAEVQILEMLEDPANSNGNGLYEPGEDVRFKLFLRNSGNNPAENLKLKIKSGGRLKLNAPKPDDLAPFHTAEIEVTARIDGTACGETFDFEVVTELDNGTWSAPATMTAGLGENAWDESFASAAPWTATEQSEGEQGVWEYGVPEATFFAGRTLQPDGGGDGAGSSAWMTSLSTQWDESALVGRAVLESNTIDVGDWYSVTGIRYRLWYQALDRANNLEPLKTPHLLVELSDNNGKSWELIDEVKDVGYRWELRETRFAPKDASSKVKLRFTAVNEGTVDDALIEVGIDQVGLVGGELLCEPVTDGCGCQSSRRLQLGDLAWLLLLAGYFGLTLRRRRA